MLKSDGLGQNIFLDRILWKVFLKPFSNMIHWSLSFESREQKVLDLILDMSSRPIQFDILKDNQEGMMIENEG